ncbi:diacylglycerol kinase family protein [Collinsella tanakaei]|uniref:diacylglycerol kinase family protein n=1 Tax=Collinsella tanakaei TaxID=626935 RepID=UPI00195D7951|nr:diacylglycerol kinase family protein [Collinsella tanakaei]MBM6778138.1 diacylglycerol kinase family protein [Collinsella tanakaei]
MIPGSEKDHPSFIRSFGYAIEGFVTAVRTERNIKVMLALGIAAVIAGIVLKIDLLSWCLVALCIGMVLFAELINTAVEAVVDLATTEFHPLAKRAKDIAAASVYTLSITAAIVGLIVFARALGFIA